MTTQLIKVFVGRIDNGAMPIYIRKGQTIREAFTKAKMPLSSKDSVTNVKTNKTVDADTAAAKEGEYVSSPKVDSARL